MTGRMEVQLNLQIFDPADPISVISFLTAFKKTCDANGIHEVAVMWLFQ